MKINEPKYIQRFLWYIYIREKVFMKVEFLYSFDNDLSNIDKTTIRRLFDKIDLIKDSSTLFSISLVKKLKWFKNYYRIRIWDYRLWFSFVDNKIVLERFLHRKDIYNLFP